ncbi:hypothetical protein [Streptomyces sp. NPDC018693]|uniref:hypothetical protein n=1 Tax=unclassified Streptomyces TaxID=2593676 RepID=UPI0037A60239
MKATAPPPARTPGSGMTIRVYTVDRYGTVTTDRGTRTVPCEADAFPELMNTQYPPCACPRHRAGVTR